MNQTLTPEEQREQYVLDIGQLCHALNVAGSQPPWTPGRIHLYVNGLYDVDDGVDSLGFKELRELIADLACRLKSQLQLNELRDQSGALALSVAEDTVRTGT